MSALCIRVPALRGPLPGEALLLPAEGSCPVLRLWPGLPEEFSRPAAGGLTASGRRAVTVAAPAPEGPWHMPEDLPFSPREAAACLDDLQRMGDAALSGQPVGTLGADVGRARRNSAESALRAGLMADGTLDAILNKYIAKEEGAAGYVSPEGVDHSNGTLVMATNAAFDPYEYIEGGEIVGIDPEFAQALCDKMGYALEIEDMEFDSIIAAVVSGKADFGMAGMTVTEERMQQIDFTDTYCTAAQNIIVLK